MTAQKKIAVAGPQDGLVDLARALTSRGLTVSVLMSAAGGGAIDRPGKDSYRHREAGAEEVMVTSAQRWALIHGGAARSGTLERRMAAVDVVLTGNIDDPAVLAVIEPGDPATMADAVIAQLGRS